MALHQPKPDDSIQIDGEWYHFAHVTRLFHKGQLAEADQTPHNDTCQRQIETLNLLNRGEFDRIWTRLQDLEKVVSEIDTEVACTIGRVPRNPRKS